MGLVIFKRYNNIGEALVAFSALESVGFHPNWNNYYHGHNELMAINAYGGNIIQIPSQEYRDAHLYLTNIKSHARIEFDPCFDTSLTRLKHSLLFLTTWAMWLFPFSLLLLIPWRIALALMSVCIFGFGVWQGFAPQNFLTLLGLMALGFVTLALLAAILTYPLRTTILLIASDIGIGLWLGFDVAAFTGLLILFLYLFLNLHAYFVALPKINRSNYEH